jgi:hypothetical protein
MFLKMLNNIPNDINTFKENYILQNIKFIGIVYENILFITFT